MDPVSCTPPGIRTEIPMVMVTGFKDSGKTTAIEGIVRELDQRGYEVGTMKHCHHGFDLDRPGKDSWRHRKAGATGTVLIGANGFAMLGGTPPMEDPQSMGAWLFPTADLILAEGFHWLALPRIEIAERSDLTRPVESGGELLAKLPYLFGQAEINTVCDLLESRVLTSPQELPKSLTA